MTIKKPRPKTTPQTIEVNHLASKIPTTKHMALSLHEVSKFLHKLQIINLPHLLWN